MPSVYWPEYRWRFADDCVGLAWPGRKDERDVRNAPSEEGITGAARQWTSAAAWCVVVVSFGGACATVPEAPFVWVDEWREPVSASKGEYVIGVGDALNVLVWDQEKMSARVRVRSDGRVSLPFLDDVNVAGMTPVALARSLEERLKQFIVTPQVTVVVEEAKPLSVSVLGQVGQPGLYSTSTPAPASPRRWLRPAG